MRLLFCKVENVFDSPLTVAYNLICVLNNLKISQGIKKFVIPI